MNAGAAVRAGEATGPIMSASLMCADLLRLGEEIASLRAAAVDSLHVDVMDGHFVPNLGLGTDTLTAVRRAGDGPVDVHLMVADPLRWIQAMGPLADRMAVHAESTATLFRCVDAMAAAGVRPGVALNPATPLAALEEVVERLHYVILMTVEPGYSGQRLIPEMADKVARARELVDRRNPGCSIWVDGNIGPDEVRGLWRQGARGFVLGSTGLFRGDGRYAERLAGLRAVAR